jgi:hypothetical protein
MCVSAERGLWSVLRVFLWYEVGVKPDCKAAVDPLGEQRLHWLSFPRQDNHKFICFHFRNLPELRLADSSVKVGLCGIERVCVRMW